MFLVSTTQRCGSTWLVRMLAAMTGSDCRYVDGTALGFDLRRVSAETAAQRLAGELRAAGGGRVFKTHDVPAKDFAAVCAVLPELRVLTVRRDFRDVLVSRYFYYRYYWPTDYALGPLPGHLARFFSAVEKADDRTALGQLIRSPLLGNWAEEWAAFEGELATPAALRVSYAGLLAGSERARLEHFVGRTLPQVDSFAETQRAEAAETGRAGPGRFNREGKCGGWKSWLTAEDSAEVAAHPLLGGFEKR